MHMAYINDNDVVENVIVVPDMTEAAAQVYCRSVLGLPGEWIQTSYNANPIDGEDRGPFAGIGFTWDRIERKFLKPIPPKPYPQWVLVGRDWQPPTPQPSPAHEWDGPLGQWVDGSGKMAPGEFVLRFSATEQPRIRYSDNPKVRAVYDLVMASPFVRPKSPVTIQAMAILKAEGMLDHATRDIEILDYENPSPPT